MHVVIIGAGFAGATAARELSGRSIDVTVLEARDRIGGRAWTGSLAGNPVDLGGQTYHWLQPHLWAEMTRYGVESYAWPRLETAYVLSQTGEMTVLDTAKMGAELTSAINKMYEASREAFPRPYENLDVDGIRALDQRSIGDRLDEITLTGIQSTLINAALQVNFNGPYREGALTTGLRRTALVMGEAKFLPEVVSYRAKGGMQAVVENILAASGATLRLNSVVCSIRQDGPGKVSIGLKGGETFKADKVILTIPFPALQSVDFTPPLNAAKQVFSKAKPINSGVMLWIEVDGIDKPSMAYAPGERPLCFFRTDRIDGNVATGQAFGANKDLIDIESIDSVGAAIKQWFPKAKVLNVAGHDWLGDPFSKQMWTMLRPGQLSTLPELQAAHGDVVFAGTDTANGWAGYFDGAIESGLRAARKVLADAPPRESLRV